MLEMYKKHWAKGTLTKCESTWQYLDEHHQEYQCSILPESFSPGLKYYCECCQKFTLGKSNRTASQLKDNYLVQ